MGNWTTNESMAGEYKITVTVVLVLCLFLSVHTETDSEGTLQEKHSYRADGKLAQSRFADGNELEYSYGINGLQQEIRTARSQRADRAAQVYAYDARGRITGIQDGNQNQTGHQMDSWGRVHQIETAEGGKENYPF